MIRTSGRTKDQFTEQSFGTQDRIESRGIANLRARLRAAKAEGKSRLELSPGHSLSVQAIDDPETLMVNATLARESSERRELDPETKYYRAIALQERKDREKDRPAYIERDRIRIVRNW